MHWYNQIAQVWPGGFPSIHILCSLDIVGSLLTAFPSSLGFTCTHMYAHVCGKRDVLCYPVPYPYQVLMGRMLETEVQLNL